ncbi:uncharacterized protein LOC141890045 isoform X1 [Acropora palmata]|uniref:uncharacterized protein LOC141890045 isoform X1 n=1 Tax=Acropora palmata TaxID=6131 RepID=UPI003DA06DE8
MKDFFESLLGRLRQIYGSDLCEVLKQTRPGSPNPIVTLTAFRESRLCGVTTLKEYISKTELLRGSESQLIVSHSKPHKAISRDTIIRYWWSCVIYYPWTFYHIITCHAWLALKSHGISWHGAGPWRSAEKSIR